MNERNATESDDRVPTDEQTPDYAATDDAEFSFRSLLDGDDVNDADADSERSARAARGDETEGTSESAPESTTDAEAETTGATDAEPTEGDIETGATDAELTVETDAEPTVELERSDSTADSDDVDGAAERTTDGTSVPDDVDSAAETVALDRTDATAESESATDPDRDALPAAASADTRPAQPDVDLSDPAYYLNRELSELAFQRRVLHEVLDGDNPLLERVKFLAIVTTNLDEFFRKRIGGLKQQIAAGVTDETPDGRTPREQWEAALEEARPLFEQQAACYREEIRPALADEGIHIVDYDDLTVVERQQLREYFESSVLPTLTPLTFDPAHPFPFISNQSLSLAVLTRERPDAELTFSRVKIPRNQLRFVQFGDDTRYVLLEDVVRANLDLLFPDVEVVDTALFRVTRNAEVRRDEEVAEDLIEMIEEVIEERRFATAVRLEIERDAPEKVREILARELDLDDREVFHLDGPLDYRDFADLTDLDRPDLKLPEWSPQPHPRLGRCEDATNVFDAIGDGDVLVHHPYHSFEGTVQRFLEAAANDPDVLAIKAAIYRTASDSQIIESLLEAARNGKQVAVMVELKARFDEENNLEWAKKLEEEGIHVAYGTIGYKTHTKTSLVVREEDDGVRLYSHVGTGNYHSETAKRYEDLGLLTADRDIGQDLVRLFNYFTGHSMHRDYRKLLIAPGNMRDRFVDLIRAEAERARNGETARIVAKMNRLEDPEIVRELYEASMAGVDIDLIVRDICRLRPGLEGISETIDVYSIVGRFLEHSRIFYFRAGGDERYYIGSADWMTRNLDNRVEAITPIEDPRLQRRLEGVLETLLSDDQNRWVMRSDGTYDRYQSAADGSTTNVHERCMRSAVDDARYNARR